MSCEVPNLLESGAAATLVVSQDLDIGVPVDRHRELKPRLQELREFEPSAEEPSLWLPRSTELLGLNFVGMDRKQDPAEAYVLEDDRLPLLVFGSARPLVVRLSVELFASDCVALVRFPRPGPQAAAGVPERVADYSD